MTIFEVLINTLKCLDGVPILYTDIPKLVGVSQGVALKLEALVGHAAKLLELLDVAGGTHGLFNDGLLQGYLLRFEASSANVVLELFLITTGDNNLSHVGPRTHNSCFLLKSCVR